MHEHWHESWCAACVIVPQTDRRARPGRLLRSARGHLRPRSLVLAAVLSVGALGCNALLDNDEAHLLEDGPPMSTEPASIDEAGAASDPEQSLPDSDSGSVAPAPCTDPKTCACQPGDPALTVPCGDCG